MSLWSLLEAVLDILFHLSNWRFALCLFGGVALALLAAANTPYEPLRWIVAGAIVVAAIVIGHRWDNAHS